MYKVGVVAQGLDTHQHGWGGGMVVGTKDIDHDIKAPLGFMPMVSDIGHPVGWFSPGLYQYPIFIVA